MAAIAYDSESVAELELQELEVSFFKFLFVRKSCYRKNSPTFFAALNEHNVCLLICNLLILLKAYNDIFLGPLKKKNNN